MDLDDVERFWSKVDITTKENCWNFLGGINRSGYGNFWLDGRIVSAHRVAWEILHKESIPDSMYILHTCDNKICCNPYHLYCGNSANNIRDSVERGLIPSKEGENNPSSKLTETDVIRLRKLYSTGKYTQASLAKQFNLNPTYVSFIVNRKRWNHI